MAVDKWDESLTTTTNSSAVKDTIIDNNLFEVQNQNLYSVNKTIMPREEWLDYLRGVGIVLMLVGHVEIKYSLMKWIYGFHMPLFYIISGYLFNKKKWSMVDYKSFAWIRFKNYIIPYFIWCIACFIINLPILLRQDNPSSALLQNIGWIITSIRIENLFLPQNCTPLWFLTSLFISQLVFYWLIKCRPITQLIIAICFVVFNLLLNFFSFPVLPWHFEVSLIGSLFMMVGHIINNKNYLNKVNSPYIIIAFIILSTLLIFSNARIDIYNRMYSDFLVFAVSSVLMVYSLMWICKNMKKYILKNVIINLGKYSIFGMGLNYSINIYARKFFTITSKWLNMNLSWTEYLIPIIDIIVCSAAIYIYKKMVLKNKKLSIIIGK